MSADVAPQRLAGVAPVAPALPPRVRVGRSLLVVATAVAWLALLWTLQIELGERLVVVPWLALAPLGVSLLLRWRQTLVVAALNVAVVAALSAWAGDLDSPAGSIRLLGSASLAAFAVAGAAIRVRREEQVRRVSEVAAVAQAAILHPVPARVGSVVMASRYVSASTDALVGGDLFDVVALPGGVRLIIGDARGKGLAALHTSAALLAAFRSIAPRSGLDLADLARDLERALLPSLAEEDFVTAALCDVRDDGGWQVVLCGHPAPLHLVSGRSAREVPARACPPLGLGVDPVVHADRLAPGERLLLVTDGLVEARDARGAFFDLPGAAARSCLAPVGRGSVPEDLDAGLVSLFAQVRAHVGGSVDDDMAALLIQPASPA